MDARDFERRIQSIVQAIILAILLWVGYSVVDLGKVATKLEVKSEQNTADMAAVKSELSTMRNQIASAAISASNAASASASAAAAALAASRK